MQTKNENAKQGNPRDCRNEEIEITAFSNRSRQDKKLLKRFVNFHWDLYREDPQYIPLLDSEYLGSRLIGLTGFFESRNLFYKHAEVIFFLATRNNEVVGRCNAFINHDHNKHWHDKVGFFGQFEAIDDLEVTQALLNSAQQWLKSKGMDAMRGPQNMPVNEATPGILTEGFESRPVIYYGYNKKYYEQLLLKSGLEPIKRVRSWEVPVMNPMEEKLERVAQKVIKRYDITIEPWGKRPFNVRRREMFEIYNDAWTGNFGFVPFEEEEFYTITEGMRLIMDKGLFQFLYVKGEPAAFMGCIPNIYEKMVPSPHFRRWEFLRMLKMFLTKSSIKGFRVGYLGVKKKFHRLGLDGVMIWKQKTYTQGAGYEYSDMGWILEDNLSTTRLADMMGSTPSKTYTIFEKKID
ncbi:MAG TPA: hypothetical protein VK469_18240 [Candidatus Kapabacteria bacterium]|nr:hypothetical protein [Candidatus Kapabacteria bacterium]